MAHTSISQPCRPAKSAQPLRRPPGQSHRFSGCSTYPARPRGEELDMYVTAYRRFRSATQRRSRRSSCAKTLSRPVNRRNPSAKSTPSISTDDVPSCSDDTAYRLVASHYLTRDDKLEQRLAQVKLMALLRQSNFDPNDIVKKVISYADTLFFQGRLGPRVKWRWSSDCQSSIIGTTTARRMAPGDYLAEITLSRKTILSDAFDQRLAIATILHETIHCYLFILRGFRAKKNGGHTLAFRNIAQLIDGWVGDPEFLQLYRPEAVLDRFRVDKARMHGGSCCGATGMPRWR